MEKQIKIPIGNKKYVYGNLRGSLKNPLIITVHGLGGFKDEHMHFNGSKFFGSKGYAVFRFNLYGYEKDARKLQDCTLSIHAKDLDIVIEHFRKQKVKKIYVVGHSYGGPTILLSKNKDFDKVVLWDPTMDLKDIEKEFKKLKSTNMYYVDWGLAVIIGKNMVEDDKDVKPLELVKEIRVPIKFIFAGKGDLKKADWDRYFSAANNPKEKVVIVNASHNFHEDGTEEKLFKETFAWLEKKDYFSSKKYPLDVLNHTISE
ncbi:alpha/beta fold hydrolase [Patescibacteria group bacterium]|nr:alpha/beta fold hydrolase [Patescibacteria group bacterium]